MPTILEPEAQVKFELHVSRNPHCAKARHLAQHLHSATIAIFDLKVFPFREYIKVLICTADM